MHHFFPYLQIIRRGYCIPTVCWPCVRTHKMDSLMNCTNWGSRAHSKAKHWESMRVPDKHTLCFLWWEAKGGWMGQIKKIKEGFLEVTSAQEWEEWGHRLRTLTSMCPGFITITSRLAVVYNRFALYTRFKACLQHLDPAFLEVSKILKGSGGPFSVYHSTKEILSFYK